jgi:hypothetical protein
MVLTGLGYAMTCKVQIGATPVAEIYEIGRGWRSESNPLGK